MTTQMTIFFDKPEVRCQFIKDIGMIVNHDQGHREEEDRINYEDALSFYMPDLDQDDRDPENETWSRMNLLHADMAINPSRYINEKV